MHLANLALAFILCTIPPSSISSKKAHYDGNTLILKGSVELEHKLGKMQSDKAHLEKEDATTPFSKILLEDNVQFFLKNEGRLQCDKADFDFTTLKATFLPKKGELIHFSHQFPKPFTLTAKRAEINFTEEKKGMTIKKVEAYDSVHIQYNQYYTLTADSAIYNEDEHCPSLVAFPNCIFTFANDQLVAERMELYPKQEKAVIYFPKGRLTTQGEAMDFSGKQMYWIENKHQLFLQGDVSLKGDKLGHILCNQIIMEEKEFDGKWRLSTISAESSKQNRIDYKQNQFHVTSERAVMEYGEREGKTTPIKLTLTGDVQIKDESEVGRCAFADQVVYFTEDKQTILLSQSGQNVLFWDPVKDLAISAKEVHITNTAQGEVIKGVGNVRFAFSSTENALLKKIFPFYQAREE